MASGIGEGGRARQLLFVQGGGEGAHDDWDARLVASLAKTLGHGHELRYPRMPSEGDPGLAAWGEALAREIEGLGAGAVLVGHSIGGTIAVHALARQPRLLRHLAMVCLIAAPYAGPGGWESDEIPASPGWAEGLSGTPVNLYQGEADEVTPMAHAELYLRAMPHARLRRLEGRDHQLNDDLSEVARDILATGGRG